jgi:hypothetical protein
MTTVGQQFKPSHGAKDALVMREQGRGTGKAFPRSAGGFDLGASRGGYIEKRGERQQITVLLID